MTTPGDMDRIFREARDAAEDAVHHLDLTSNLSDVAALGAKSAFFYAGFMSTYDHLHAGPGIAMEAMKYFIQWSVFTDARNQRDRDNLT